MAASQLEINAAVECDNGKFADVTFVIADNASDDGKTEFRGILGIFCMQCPYFAKVFFEEEKDDDIRYPRKYTETDKDITPVAFKYIQQYLYRLNPQITVKNVIDVSYAAKRYGLDDVVKRCNEFIESIYNPKDEYERDVQISHILSFEARALQFKLATGHPIRKRFQTWLSVETSETIIRSKAFLSAPKEVIIEIIQNDSFSVKV